MDSRIREIEQWIAEAKHDLGERGREAYLEKLYLLDAEIRSVIRENGVSPQSASPRAAVRRVRRWHAPQALASGAAFGIMLLAASTVYFASPGAVLSWQPQGLPQRLASIPGRTDVNLPAGEEFMFAGGVQSHPILTTLPSSPSEEKAGEKTPSDMQAPESGVASPGNSKPTALAHSLGQAPASTTPKVKVEDKPATAPPKQLLASAAKPLAPAAAKIPSPKPHDALPAKAQPSTPVEDVPIVVPASLSVDKSAVDNGDSEKKIDPKALEDLLKKNLDALNG